MYCFVLDILLDGQAGTIQSAGCVRLDINLLKPSRLELQDEDLSPNMAFSPNSLEYVYRSSHPVLRWLPTKLAEWIGENLQEALGFPDKGDVRAGPGSGWTAAELNHILQAHVVDGTLTTFGCVEWESEQFRGVMRARCYPFKMSKRRFHGMNPQVYSVTCTILYRYKPVYTSMYQYLLVCTSMYQCILVNVHTSTYCYVLICTSTYLYILVCTGTYY